ncbi:integrase catalytic domain-containing protein [Trichonephila clavipes]|uniref:Integrase catalytic domain-containing protein n=1 Tax=Trichonephila clavipes TaxID=2585209 RepID=A0A8X6RG38_TRICX|nr:integrase catalytic domain-containing protein [Trichonephila clavipes]
MSIVVKLKKDELKLVSEEIGLTVPREAKRVDLKRLIEESDVFKEDYEFVKTVIEQLLEETKTQESELNSQLELERLKLERVKAELELAQLGTNASKSETSFNKCETEMSIDVFIKSFPKELKNVSSGGEKRSFPDNPEVVNKSRPGGECSWSLPPQVGCQGFVSTNLVENKKNVLLSTVLCLIKDKYSQWQKVRGLLDVGSQINLISNECLQRLQLKGEKINQSISCINNTSLTVNRGVKASIASESKSFKRNISMLVVQKITDLIPNKFIDAHVQIPESVRLADPNFKIPGKIDILLSAEYFYDGIKPGKINVKNSNLILQDSVFGYIVGGSVEDELNLYSCGLICGSEELNSSWRKFWEIEEIDNELPKNLENSICEEHYAQTHKRDESGKYIVSIPFKEHWLCLGNSKDIALKRLESLWTRLSRDQDYQKLYRDFLKEYEELGHMTEIKESVELEYTYYMPHHGIYRPQKSTTKLRTVFNASALTANGKSLNFIQYNGGVIQNDLFSLLVRFRKHIYAFTADIRQMYRMIDADVSQRPLQRILWKGNVNVPVKVYQLNTVTYGTASAPFLAMRTLKQISIDEGENFPLAASVLCDDFYMNDVLSGANSLEVAKTLQHQLIDILQTAQMSLHKWCGYTSELIPTTEKEYDFASPEEIKTLGIAWNSKTDCFNFKVEVEQNAHPTKTSVLSIIARLFDPLGLLGSVITKAKIFMQQLWTLQIDWSERLPEKEASEWKEFVRSLVALNGINIERCIVIPNAEVTEFHGFCDASERAYGAAIYARSINPDGEIKVKLVASKSRVSPIKQHHVPSEQNPAEIISRGLDPEKFQRSELWCFGPAFLEVSSVNFPRYVDEIHNCEHYQLELKDNQESMCFLVQNREILLIIDKCSSFLKLQRILAWCVRFKENARNPLQLTTGSLTVAELSTALICLVRNVQSVSFAKKICCLERRQLLPVSSNLLTLSPFLDQRKILCVGGRLRHSNLPAQQKHPILIPNNHSICDLIIKHYHVLYLHTGIEATLANIRTRFWIVNGRSKVKGIIKQCIKCFKVSATGKNQRMADLPNARVSIARVFSKVGLDFCGPFHIKLISSKAKKVYKCYICIFVCFVVKAIHLEIVSNLSTEAFIGSLKRFISRRGRPSDIFSDNGTNFVGANTEFRKILKGLIKKESSEKFEDFLASESIQWHFNPPATPHFGGLWEAGVKSLKNHLKRVVGNNIFLLMKNFLHLSHKWRPF